MADAPKIREIPVYSPDMANPYMPYIATLKEVVRETHNIMTFRVVLDDEFADRRRGLYRLAHMRIAAWRGGSHLRHQFASDP